MAGMFSRCEQFNQLLERWDVSKVRDMKICFGVVDILINPWKDGMWVRIVYVRYVLRLFAI